MTTPGAIAVAQPGARADGPNVSDGAALEPEDPADDGAAEPAQAELRELTVDAQGHGQRLDQWLAAHVAEFSRSYIRVLIESGCVSRQGLPELKPARRLKADEQLSVTLRPTPSSDAYRAEPVEFAVVHEDEHLLVIDKPAGLVVHPAAGNWSGTLLNGLLHRYPASGGLPRAGIVHRLDKDTSGLMMVARTRPAMDRLVRQIAAREVSRRYLALGHRPWTGPATRLVEAAIGRDPRNRLRMAALDAQQHPAREAATDFTLIGTTASHCLVEASLRTGRTHQIRVHMAHIGHPLVGDVLYGGQPQAGMRRQALHAWRLSLHHPATGDTLAFEAPPPADFIDALDQTGLRYNPSL